MSNAIFIAIGCLVLLNMILFIAFKTVSEKLDMSKLKNSEYEYTIRQLKTENYKLRDEMKTIAQNRREADEKIVNLHNGDAVANAINGLSKPTGSDSGKNDSSRD